MFPVLLSFGPIVLSTAGFFIALGFLSAVFIAWRLAKVYDIKEEKIFDLSIAVFAGGLVVSRLVAVVLNLEAYQSLEKILYFHKYPGLSFWGAFAGGTLALWLFSRIFKLPLWQVADFAAVGALLALALGNLGCFLGGCGYGVVSDLPIALPVVGVIGKRLPISLIEGLILLFIFFRLYKQVIKFHFAGKILAKFLIILGLVKFLTEFYRGDGAFIFPNLWITYGHILSLAVFGAGLVAFYAKSKRSIFKDAEGLLDIFSSAKKREVLLSSVKKSWYNHRTAWKIAFNKSFRIFRKVRRKLNVRPTPTDIR